MPEFSTKGRTAADPGLHAHTCGYRRTFVPADCCCTLHPQLVPPPDAMATRHAAYIQRQARALLDDQDPNWQDGPLTPSRVTQLERDLAAEREISSIARAEVRRLEAVITELADPGGHRAKFLAAMIRQLDHQIAARRYGTHGARRHAGPHPQRDPPHPWRWEAHVSEMIERVARAIQTAIHPPLAGKPAQNHYIEVALVAIEAMHEPTEAMIRAGEDEPTGPRAYRAMIRAAFGDAT